MSLKLIATLFSFAAVTACASNPIPTKQTALVEIKSPTAVRVVQVSAADRAPAGSPTLNWEPATITIPFSRALSTQTVGVDVKQLMSWMDTEYFQDSRNEWQDVLVPSTCYEVKCPQSGGGRSELWDAFFSARKADKAAALANAVKGVGDKSAAALVAANTFSSKPRSWADFSQTITRAGEQGIIAKGVATNVLNQYRNANIANLGYGEGACTQTAYACTVPVQQLVSVPFRNSRPVRRERVQDTRHFELRMSTQNAVLMTGEIDTVSVTVNENGRAIEPAVTGTKNRYTVRQTGVNVEFLGTQRFLTPLSRNVIRKDSFIYVNSTPTFVVEVLPEWIPNSEDPNSQLVISYTLRSCKHGTFGGCAWSRDEKVEKIESVLATNSMVQIPFTLTAKRLYWIDYKVERTGSLYYSGDAVTRQTDTLVAL